MPVIVRFLEICVVLFTIGASASWAGELDISLKSGYLSWHETIQGSDFVKEEGVANALGISARETLADAFPVGAMLEIWGGVMDYDGHDPTGDRRLTGDSIIFGTREEATAGVNIGDSAIAVVTPFGGLGHKFWIMSKTSEDWNMLYGLAGATVKLVGAVALRGGVALPFYARNHASLERAGFSDVVITPEGRPSVFAEGGVTFGAWHMSIGYEEMNFAESERVMTRNLQSLSESAIAVVNYQAFQPETSWKYLFLKVSYSF